MANVQVIFVVPPQHCIPVIPANVALWPCYEYRGQLAYEAKLRFKVAVDAGDKGKKLYLAQRLHIHSDFYDYDHSGSLCAESDFEIKEYFSIDTSTGLTAMDYHWHGYRPYGNPCTQLCRQKSRCNGTIFVVEGDIKGVDETDKQGNKQGEYKCEEQSVTFRYTDPSTGRQVEQSGASPHHCQPLGANDHWKLDNKYDLVVYQYEVEIDHCSGAELAAYRRVRDPRTGAVVTTDTRPQPDLTLPGISALPVRPGSPRLGPGGAPSQEGPRGPREPIGVDPGLDYAVAATGPAGGDDVFAARGRALASVLGASAMSAASARVMGVGLHAVRVIPARSLPPLQPEVGAAERARVGWPVSPSSLTALQIAAIPASSRAPEVALRAEPAPSEQDAGPRMPNVGGAAGCRCSARGNLERVDCSP